MVYDEENPLLVSKVTPLMHCIHELVNQSGELDFVDSSSNMEEYNLSVFLMMTHCIIGALPLCVLITSDEKVDS